MRLTAIIILLLSVAAGIVLGALNADLVSYDLLFARFRLPKGAALLCGLALGWLLGGLTAWLGVSARQRRRHGQAPKAERTLVSRQA